MIQGCGPKSFKSNLGSWPVLVHVTSTETKMMQATYALLAKTVGHSATSLLVPEPQISDIELTSINGRVLGCSHEICADCLLQLRGAPITHDGQL